MYAINRTYVAVGGAMFISLLSSGSNVSTVNANCSMQIKQEGTCSNVFETIITDTDKKDIYFSNPGYTFNKNVYTGVGDIFMDKEKIHNLKKIDQISCLEDGWNGNKAKAFESQLLTEMRSIITVLRIQPELFPTACGSLQLEYEKEDGSYLEIEATLEDTWEVFEIDDNGDETYFSIHADIDSIIKLVDNFYG